MHYLVIDKITGFINQVITYMAVDIEPEVFQDDKIYLRYYGSLEAQDLCTNYYYKDNLKKIPSKPALYYTWNLSLEQWEEPEGYLQTIRADGNKQINQLASQKILSKYPIYKQFNIGRTSDAQIMYDWIDNIRNLSNIATASIEQAVTQEEITAIVDNFKTELTNIP